MNISKILRFFLGILVLLLLALITPTIVQEINQFNVDQQPISQMTFIRTSAPTRPSYCVPIPKEITNNSTLTSTPDRYSTQVPNTRPTVTPRPYHQVIDLSPELSLQDKSQIIVFRCNGTFDLFLAGPDINIKNRIVLSAGDMIINTIPPASLMGHRPTRYLATITVTISTPIPYPAPITPTISTSTILPYPAPSTSTPIN